MLPCFFPRGDRSYRFLRYFFLEICNVVWMVVFRTLFPWPICLGSHLDQQVWMSFFLTMWYSLVWFPEFLFVLVFLWWTFLVAQMVKNTSTVKKTWVQFLGWEDPLEKGMVTHSSILAWRRQWSLEAIVHGVAKSWTWLSD